MTPQTWTDHRGKTWRTPQIKGRLKMKIPSHAALREYILARDGQCMRCGAKDGLVADHILSRRNGGVHHPSNLQALCEPCNARKANREDRTFQRSEAS